MLCKGFEHLSSGCPDYTSIMISNVSVISSLVHSHDASFLY